MFSRPATYLGLVPVEILVLLVFLGCLLFARKAQSPPSHASASALGVWTPESPRSNQHQRTSPSQSETINVPQAFEDFSFAVPCRVAESAAEPRRVVAIGFFVLIHLVSPWTFWLPSYSPPTIARQAGGEEGWRTRCTEVVLVVRGDLDQGRTYCPQ